MNMQQPDGLFLRRRTSFELKVIHSREQGVLGVMGLEFMDVRKELGELACRSLPVGCKFRRQARL